MILIQITIAVLLNTLVSIGIYWSIWSIYSFLVAFLFLWMLIKNVTFNFTFSKL